MTAAGQPEGRKKKQKKERRTGIAGLIELVVIVGVALGMALLIQAFIVKPFGVPSQSMENTLQIGDRIVVNRLDGSIARGDIVVFGHGDTWEQTRRSPATSALRRAVRFVGDVTGMGPRSSGPGSRRCRPGAGPHWGVRP